MSKNNEDERAQEGILLQYIAYYKALFQSHMVVGSTWGPWSYYEMLAMLDALDEIEREHDRRENEQAQIESEDPDAI